MAGGTWTVQNKVRPGVYINFVSEPKPLGTPSDRGIVTMALPLSWGPEKQVIEINAGDDVYDVLGYDITAPQLLLVKEALKRAKTLLLYRLNQGTKATATIGTNLTATALATIETYEWNTVALPSDDATLKPIYAAYVKRLREDEGKYVQAVLANYPTADYEG